MCNARSAPVAHPLPPPLLLDPLPKNTTWCFWQAHLTCLGKAETGEPGRNGAWWRVKMRVTEKAPRHPLRTKLQVVLQWLFDVHISSNLFYLCRILCPLRIVLRAKQVKREAQSFETQHSLLCIPAPGLCHLKHGQTVGQRSHVLLVSF